jgi:putative transposase
MKDNIAIIVVMFWGLFLRVLFRNKRDQELLMLRKELQIIKRQSKKPKFNNWDRLFFVSIFKANANVINNAITLRPSTIISWHRKLIKKKWDYTREKLGRRPITEEIRQLILQMKAANRRWGCRKIEGELRKLGITVGKTAIAEILKNAGYLPGNREFERTWLNFLTNHTTRYFACDFMVVDTLFLKRLYLFSVMDTTNREIILFNVTANPTALWLENVVRSGFIYLDNLPQVMISDRDGIYGDWYGEFLETYFSIELIRTPPRCPNCNSFIERWHRTFREEVLDHCLVFGEKDLRRLTSEFIKYYNEFRPHQGLGQNSPLKNHEPNPVKTVPKICQKKMVDGLIKNFELAA